MSDRPSQETARRRRRFLTVKDRPYSPTSDSAAISLHRRVFYLEIVEARRMKSFCAFNPFRETARPTDPIVDYYLDWTEVFHVVYYINKYI